MQRNPMRRTRYGPFVSDQISVRRQTVPLNAQTRRRLQAYRETAYQCPGLGTVRIGQSTPFRLQDGQQWVILTAHNPASERLTSEQNRTRAAALERWLDTRRYHWHACTARADAGDWPEETGCLVMNADQALCNAAASKWGQNAVVYGHSDTDATLLIVRPEWLTHCGGEPEAVSIESFDILDTHQGSP